MKTCRSCHYWDNHEIELDRDDPEMMGHKAEQGTCRRYAPQPYSVQLDEQGNEPKYVTRWPPAASDDGCGQWEPRID